MEVQRWDGVEATPNRRIGHAPDDLPRDGQWYIMRSSEWVDAGESKAVLRLHSQRITQARKYLSRTSPDGFEVTKVREQGDVGSVNEGRVRWHMLGRWTV